MSTYIDIHISMSIYDIYLGVSLSLYLSLYISISLSLYIYIHIHTCFFKVTVSNVHSYLLFAVDHFDVLKAAALTLKSQRPEWIPFGDHPLKLERYRLAWHLRKDDTHKSRSVNKSQRPEDGS